MKYMLGIVKNTTGSLCNVLVQTSLTSPPVDVTPHPLPGLLAFIPPAYISRLLLTLDFSYEAAALFDSRPGLKFLVQKVAGLDRAANLFRQAAAAWLVKFVALFELCLYEIERASSIISGDMVKTVLEESAEEGNNKEQILSGDVAHYLQQLKHIFTNLCDTYIEILTRVLGVEFAMLVVNELLLPSLQSWLLDESEDNDEPNEGPRTKFCGLFLILKQIIHTPGVEFAMLVVNELLLPSLQSWLREAGRNFRGWDAMCASFKLSCGLTSDLVVTYLHHLHGMNRTHEADPMLRQLLVLMTECCIQAHEGIARLGCACLRHVILSCGKLFTPPQWGQFTGEDYLRRYLHNHPHTEPTSINLPEEIEEQRRNSIVKDSESHLAVWAEMLVSVFQVLSHLDNAQWKLFLPVVFPGVRKLTAHATHHVLKQSLADFFQRIAEMYGFSP
ncbi:brefeldin A-inhibited guanine nucleotide-exchange protein 3-like [Diaphorina citri]|uniref:Brefeldin A-inhibited guanine nucleotide-exchange protein 3-like n=1 Tax=Diaphorina citri TaxID=121845 RepID=A0A3Q0J6D5_DIACI|nr:brefeldin A-inhibited guanine nucleotide-exchange protein 3-like [Diaphorina citri]